MGKISLSDMECLTLEKAEKKQLVEKLAMLQRQIRYKKIPVMILIDGWGAAGKGTIINQLMIPLDPRWFIVYNEARVTHELRHRPMLYRFWCDSPADGEMVLFNNTYYKEIYKRARKDGMVPEELIKEINEFEQSLIDSGTVILKFFLQISREEQQRRLETLEDNPITRWRVSEEDWKENRNYNRIASHWNKIFPKTDTKAAPWTILDSNDVNAASDTLLLKLTTVLETAIRKKEEAERTAAPLVPLVTADAEAAKKSPLDQFSKKNILSKTDYRNRLRVCQKQLRDLEFLVFRERIPVVIAFEGFDAAGKGGAIKRVCENLDPRGYRVYPSSAPTDEEKAHDWLWRYWRGIPKRGHFSIFDRTWYGRVLVEPIEGLLSKEDYAEAFGQINEFENQLVQFGTVLVKFWMNVSPEEQARRFQEREADPLKHWKITDEDWRNREKRDAYVVAADRMFKETSTKDAPWTIIDGDDKYYTRITVMEAIIKAITASLSKKSQKLL